jgi:hypothetical protein
MMVNLWKNTEIVVAHYNEDIDRLRPYANNVIIYHKWNEKEPRFQVKKWIKLKNIWREWHTYLYHIINNYGKLADITVFLQWWMDDQLKKKVVYEKLERYEKETKKYWFSTRRMRFMRKRNPQIRYRWKFKKMIENWTIIKAKESFESFYENIFHEKQPYFIPHFICWNFWVTREKIQNRSLPFYENIIKYFVNENPEEWHYLERLWFKIFNSKLHVHYLIKIIADPFVFLSTIKKRLKS